MTGPRVCYMLAPSTLSKTRCTSDDDAFLLRPSLSLWMHRSKGILLLPSSYPLALLPVCSCSPALLVCAHASWRSCLEEYACC